MLVAFLRIKTLAVLTNLKEFCEHSHIIVQLTRPSKGTYLEQIATEMGPVQFFAPMYAEYHTKSLVCSVGWNHVKF